MTGPDILVPTSDLDVDMGAKALGLLELALHRLGAEHPGTEVEAKARAACARARALHLELQGLLDDVRTVRPASEVGA